MKTRYTEPEVRSISYGYWMNYGVTLFVSDANFGPEDETIIFFTKAGRGAGRGDSTFVSHVCKLYYTSSGRVYFRYKNKRVYLDECLRF